MANSKRLRNAGGVRGTHPDGTIGSPAGHFVKGNGPSGDRVADGTEASETTADTTDLVNFGLHDLRPNVVQVITLTSYDNTDTVVFTATREDGVVANSAATSSLDAGTHPTAAEMQTLLRALTGDDLLIVTGTAQAGPFTVTFSGRLPSIPTLSVTAGTGSAAGTVASVANKATIGQLGESVLPVIVVSATDATGPATGGIDVNYTIGAYTGVEVVITEDGNPYNVLFDGFEASSTPFRVEAADFEDGVGPGAAAACDVYVRGYILTDPADNAEFYTFGPFAAKVDGTTGA